MQPKTIKRIEPISPEPIVLDVNNPTPIVKSEILPEIDHIIIVTNAKSVHYGDTPDKEAIENSETKIVDLLQNLCENNPSNLSESEKELETLECLDLQEINIIKEYINDFQPNSLNIFSNTTNDNKNEKDSIIQKILSESEKYNINLDSSKLQDDKYFFARKVATKKIQKLTEELTKINKKPSSEDVLLILNNTINSFINSQNLNPQKTKEIVQNLQQKQLEDQEIEAQQAENTLKLVKSKEPNIPLISKQYQEFQNRVQQKIANKSQKYLTHDIAKHYFDLNKKEIEEQLVDTVALYSIKNKSPFFFISQPEARLAIEFIKEQRKYSFTINQIKEIQYNVIIHAFENLILNQIPNLLNPPDNPIDHNILLTEYPNSPQLNQQLATLADYKNAFLYTDTIFNRKNNSTIASQLSLNTINNAFSIAESHDLYVSHILFNAKQLANIRTICYQYQTFQHVSLEEMLKFPKLFGRFLEKQALLFNQLPDNLIFVVAFKAILPNIPNDYDNHRIDSSIINPYFFPVLIQNTEN